MTDYLIKYLSPSGIFIDNFITFSRLEYAKKENEVGVMTLTVPQSYLTPMLDGRLEIYRRVGAGGYNLEFDTQWLIRGWSRTSQGNVSTLSVKAYDATEILKRRIVAFAAETPQAAKTRQTDDMMKKIVRENFGAAAVGARSITGYLSVQVDTSSAPIVSKEFSWKQVLPTLQDLAQSSLNLGTYLVFDVVKLSDSVLEFRTYPGQRGVNRGGGTTTQLTVSDLNGALGDISLDYDYTEEGNYVYAGGQGNSIDRIISERTDAARALATVINRREIFRDARNVETSTSLDNQADDFLKEARPKIIFDGTLKDTTGIVYGVDYGYGDIVTAQYEDVVMDCHINVVHVTVEKGQETIDIKLRGETYA